MRPFHHGFPLLCLTSDVGFCVQCCLEAESQKQGDARMVLPLLFLNALKRRGSLCVAALGHKEDAIRCIMIYDDN